MECPPPPQGPAEMLNRPIYRPNDRPIVPLRLLDPILEDGSLEQVQGPHFLPGGLPPYDPN